MKYILSTGYNSKKNQAVYIYTPHPTQSSWQMKFHSLTCSLHYSAHQKVCNLITADSFEIKIEGMLSQPTNHQYLSTKDASQISAEALQILSNIGQEGVAPCL